MADAPTLIQGPEPAETTDLHFKLVGKVQIFEPNVKFESGKYSLLAVSHYYGLIFVGNSNGFSVLQSKFIKTTADFNQCPKKDISIGNKPSQILTDFTQKFLAVSCNTQSGAVLYIYNIITLASKEILPLKVFYLSKLAQNLSANVSEILWQPNADGIIMVCMSDGSVLSINPNAQENASHALPSTVQALCFCWSPKGKQIVIGCAKGFLSQYKPDLKLVKTLPPPPLFNGAVIVIGVFWISNYQFAVSYNQRNNPTSSPVFSIVNAVKNEPISVINYDDIIYYSSRLLRQHQIYISYQNEWNLIFISSANSIEVAVLRSKDNAAWEQWLLGDASRAELPLNNSRQETFPIGMAFDLSSNESILWGENTLPPMPHLLLLSNEGVLCIYNVVNLMASAPQLCTSPKEYLPDSIFAVTEIGIPTAVSNVDVVSSSTVVPPASGTSTQISKPLTPQLGFGKLKPTFTFGSNMNSEVFSFQSQNNVPQTALPNLKGSNVSETKDNAYFEQQQPISQTKNIISFNTPSSISQNLSNKVSIVASQFGTSSPHTFTFGSPLANSTTAVSGIFTKQNSALPTLTLSAQTVPTESPEASKNKETTSKAPNLPENINLPQSITLKAIENLPKSVPQKFSTTEEKACSGSEDTVVVEENAAVESPSDSSTPALPELPAIDESVYLNALQDEIEHFNSELKIHFQKLESMDFQIGTPEDKIKLQSTMEQLNVFCKELNEITLSQSAEIHSVVTDLMESFAWLEDAKSRNIQRKNPSFIELKKSEELDPISARHMNEIGYLKYYIENQLKQLTSHLEKEWMNHQDNYRTRIKSQMMVPPLEEVYKTMHFQLKILNKQRALVEDLKSKMMAKKRQNKLFCSFNENSFSVLPSTHGTNRTVELSKLADNLLQLKINRETSSSAVENWKAMQSQLKTIRDRSKKLTLEKQSALREALSERDMVKIRPVKTSFESSSFLRSLILKKSSKVDTKEVEGQRPEKEKLNSSSIKTKMNASTGFKTETKSKEKSESFLLQSKNQGERQPAKESPKTDFGVESITVEGKPLLNNNVTLSQSKEKSALDSLSSVVSNLGKESDFKLTTVSGNLPSKPQSQVMSSVPVSKEFFTFGMSEIKFQKKTEDVKTSTPMFTFGRSKPEDTVVGRPSELSKSDGKITFGAEPLTFSFSKQEPSKLMVPKISVSTSSSPLSSAPSPFTFSSAPNTSTASVGPPKMNLFLSNKDQKSGPITTTAPLTENIFAPSVPSASTLSFTSSNIFGSPKVAVSTASMTTTATAPSTTFTFIQSPTNQKILEPETSVIEKNSEKEKNKETSNEVKKVEESKFAPKPPTNFVFGASTTQTKTTSATIFPSTSISNVQPTSSSQNPTITNLFDNSVSAVTTAPTISPSLVFGQVKGAASTISSEFSFNTGKNSASVLNQTALLPQQATETTEKSVEGITTPVPASVTAATTTTPTITITTTAPITTSSTTTMTVSSTSTTMFSTTSTISNSQQTISTTPSTEKPSTVLSTSIFGNSTTPGSKPIFAQNSTSTPQTTKNIFGGSPSLTPATNTFGQPSSPTSTSVFNDSVTKTTNIFGQLLSESNQMGNLFVTSSATSTSTAQNPFSTQKNIFGNSSTIASTGSVFGETNTSLFAQSSSPFGGQPSTTSTIFGQTPTSNSFFGQNICSPFSANSSTTSNQNNSLESGGFESKSIFGQSNFNQISNNTPIFGSSLFGGVSNSTSNGTNVFQATNSFGGPTPGPFSSSAQGSVAETGFKAVNTFQQPLGSFGSPSVFGSSPPSTSGFGMAPTFSSSPLFGSQAVFGSVPTVFNSTQGTFGQSQGHSTTFENLANQNPVGFGNLAQQSQQNQGFGGFKSTFTGDSFSSWRSK